MKKTAFCVLFSFLSHLVQAQDSTRILDEVVVTADKSPGKSLETGKVLRVITRAMLDQAGNKDLSQILTEQTGLFINGAYSNSGKDKSVYLRGAKVDHTLILIDGVPVYDPSGIGSNFDIRLIHTQQVERVEILMGSQSTLYGSDAMAGVINIITRKADARQPLLSGELAYGSYQSLRSHLALNKVWKKADIQLSYSRFQTEGITEAADSSAGGERHDQDRFHQQTVSFRMGLRPHRRIQIAPFVRYSNFRQEYDQAAFLDELDLTSRNSNWQAGTTAEWKREKTELRLLYQYQDNDRFYQDDSVKSRNGYDTYNEGSYWGREHYGELYGVFRPLKALTLTAGMDYRSSNSDQSFSSIGFFGPYQSSLSRDSLRQHQTSVYALFRYQSGGFNASWGGRWNRHSTYGSNAVYSLNPSYVWNNRWKFFANLSTSYKTPTLYQLYSEYGNRDLKPEEALTWEGGVQYFTRKGKGSTRINAYRRDVKNLIFFYTDPATFQSYYINQDRQNDYGIEWEGRLQTRRGEEWRAGYSYVDGRITTLKNGKDTSYFNLIRRPRHTAHLYYGRSWGQRWSMNLTVNYTGSRTDVAYDASFNRIDLTLKGYVLLNAYVSYRWPAKKLMVFTEWRNLTNSQYQEAYGFQTMGLNGSVGVRYGR